MIRTQILYIRNSSGLNWFLDYATRDGWKNIGSYKTRDEAIAQRVTFCHVFKHQQSIGA